MDLRDCQKLAGLVARTFPEPAAPFQTLARIFQDCGGLAQVVHAVERNGRRDSTEPAPVDELRGRLAELLVSLADLANGFGLDLAEAMETRRRAFFEDHPELLSDEAPPAIPRQIEKVTVYAASS